MILPKKYSGFTLIELLVVIGILAVLLAITLIAINPQRQFQQSNNTKRKSDVSAILNAAGQYAADHKGSLPVGIGTSSTDVKVGGADICADLVPTYIAAMPTDPTAGSYTSCSTYDTGYFISKNNNRVTVTAPSAEDGEVISVTR